MEKRVWMVTNEHFPKDNDLYVVDKFVDDFQNCCFGGVKNAIHENVLAIEMSTEFLLSRPYYIY